MFLFNHNFSTIKKEKKIVKRKTGESKDIMLFKLHFLTLTYQFFQMPVIDKH